MVEFKDGKIEITDYLLAIPAFNLLYKKDKSKTKEQFYLQLLFLYFMYDHNSPYFDYPEPQRYELVFKHVLTEKDKKLFINNKELDLCIEVYKSKKPIEIKLLEDCMISAYKLGEFLRNVDFKELDDNGRPVYNPKDINVILKSAGDIINSLKTLRQKAKEALSNDFTEDKELFEDD